MDREDFPTLYSLFSLILLLELSFESKAVEIIACVQNLTYEPGLFTIPSTVNQKVIFFD
jgi:hypothetical protein